VSEYRIAVPTKDLRGPLLSFQMLDTIRFQLFLVISCAPGPPKSAGYQRGGVAFGGQREADRVFGHYGIEFLDTTPAGAKLDQTGHPTEISPSPPPTSRVRQGPVCR